MRHDPRTKAAAIKRMKAGETPRQVAKRMKIGPQTAERWWNEEINRAAAARAQRARSTARTPVHASSEHQKSEAEQKAPGYAELAIALTLREAENKSLHELVDQQRDDIKYLRRVIKERAEGILP